MLLQCTLFPSSQGSVFTFNISVTNPQAKKDLIFSFDEYDSVWDPPERMVERQCSISLYEDDVFGREWGFPLNV